MKKTIKLFDPIIDINEEKVIKKIYIVMFGHQVRVLTKY